MNGQLYTRARLAVNAGSFGPDSIVSYRQLGNDVLGLLDEIGRLRRALSDIQAVCEREPDAVQAATWAAEIAQVSLSDERATA